MTRLFPFGRGAGLPALLLSGAILLSASCRPNASAAEAFGRAEKLRAAGLVADAQTVYGEAIKRDPHYAPPYRALAEMATAARDNPAAVAYWTDYVKREPHPDHGWCRLAQAEMLSGREVPALQHAERELTLDPDCARAHLSIGLLYAKKSNAREALTHLKKAARAYPNVPQVHLIYGRVLALTGAYDDAEKVLSGILTRDEVDAEPYHWLGYVYARRSQTTTDAGRAEKMLRRALELQPDYGPANFELGRLLARERRAGEAIPLLKRAAEINRNDATALFSLAEAYARLGKDADATTARTAFKKRSDRAARRKSLLRRYAVNPKDGDVNLELGRIELERGDPQTALLFLQAAQSFAPGDARVAAALKTARKQLPPSAAADNENSRVPSP